MTITPKMVIFTDLDGTLLDESTYSFDAALPALHVIKQEGIPLIIASSKTRAEIELYRRRLENRHPFISENGGAVFVPEGYFPFPFHIGKALDGYSVFELGTPYRELIAVLDSIRSETGISIKGFSELPEAELVALCGLTLEEARLAKKREYGEPFIIEGNEDEIEVVKRKIEEKGMDYACGGRFNHLLGKNDKGKAVQRLKGLYEQAFGPLSAVGIGNSLNDLPMLMAVDVPVLFEEEGAGREIPFRNVTKVKGSGPSVWNRVVLSIIRNSQGTERRPNDAKPGFLSEG